MDGSSAWGRIIKCQVLKKKTAVLQWNTMMNAIVHEFVVNS